VTIEITGLDHLVLTVADIARTLSFYSRVLGMTPQRFVSGGVERHALAFGSQKFNLHQTDHVLDPNVRHATPGSADLCLLTETPIATVIEHLGVSEVPVILGPVRRTGAVHPLISVYFYDPDDNLIEVSNALRN
jgi:catechol 2,3-dioxygenase-like lactoylglutathione lyase family enzyme